ncbi:MAG: hypothetical protein HYV07_28955 [Deltaproteobacteria bacterium]|nr:hypothetical protein [Deltaproteobacteria bacterium]
MFVLLLLAAPVEKDSEAVSAPAEAWAEPGFRVGTGYGLEVAFARFQEPAGMTHSFALRVGARVEADWSLFLDLSYDALDGTTPSLFFRALVGPALHLSDEVTLSLGFGLGGAVAANTGGPTPAPESRPVASYTVPSGGPRLSSCAGAGASLGARLDHALVTSELLSMGPSIALAATWTVCREAIGRSDPDTGATIELEQLWEHHFVSVGWTFWWR